MFKKIQEELKKYASQWNMLTEAYKAEKKKINEDYNQTGTLWHQMFTDLKSQYDSNVESALKESRDKIYAMIEENAQMNKAKLTDDVDLKVVAQLELLKTTKVTQLEIEQYLKKYYNNHLVVKVLKEIAKDNGILVTRTVTIEDYLVALDEVKGNCWKFFQEYRGTLNSYHCEWMLAEAGIVDTWQEEYKMFI